MPANNFSSPNIIHCGTVNGLAGTPTITLTGAYQAATPVSVSKGVYTVQLGTSSLDAAVTANDIIFEADSLTAGVSVVPTLSGTTLTLTGLTQAAGAAAEFKATFKVIRVNIG